MYEVIVDQDKCARVILRTDDRALAVARARQEGGVVEDENTGEKIPLDAEPNHI